MSRELVLAAGWMRLTAIAPQGISEPLWAKDRLGSYVDCHRHDLGEIAMVFDEVVA